MHTGDVQLYDLTTDLGELFDVSAAHPETVARAKRYLDAAHVPNPNWVPRTPKTKTKRK